MASCSVLCLPAGSSLGPDRFDPVPLLSVEDGIVFVSASTGESGRRVVVSVAGAESILPAPAARERLEALVDARLTLIPRGAHRCLLETPAAVAIVASFEVGLRDSRESLAQVGSRRLGERVRLKLVQLARAYGRVGTEGLLLDLPLTHELLADMVGSRRETVTRALAELAREGVIQHDHGRYRVAVPRREIAS
jgi:CRP-like cAMP-binding protein